MLIVPDYFIIDKSGTFFHIYWPLLWYLITWQQIALWTVMLQCYSLKHNICNQRKQTQRKCHQRQKYIHENEKISVTANFL